MTIYMPTAKKTTEEKLKKPEIKEEVKFKGKYTEAVGKRKTASATVRLYKNGNGNIIVNGMKINQYFTNELAAVATQPIKLIGAKEANFSVVVRGGGKSGQADAVKLGISRVLIKSDKDLKTTLKAKDFLTRDSRKKERKKPGLKRARRAPQWSKR